MDAGYSGKTVAQKLGLTSGMHLAAIQALPHYRELLSDIPDGAVISDKLRGKHAMIHLFAHNKHDLEEHFLQAKNHLAANGSLWVSWPKGSSGVETDLNENVIRRFGLANGLVDVTVIAVDETWSGLKFVYRLKDRKP